MKNFRLDKAVFKAQRFEEAVKNNLFDKTVSPSERLRMAFHLTCRIYGIKDGDPLTLDRTFFSARKF